MDIKDFVEMFITTHRLTHGLKHSFGKDGFSYISYFYFYSMTTGKAFAEIGIGKNKKIITRFWISKNDKSFIKLIDQMYQMKAEIFEAFELNADDRFYYEIEIEKNQTNLEWYNEFTKDF